MESAGNENNENKTTPNRDQTSQMDIDELDVPVNITIPLCEYEGQPMEQPVDRTSQVMLYAPITGPKIYDVKENTVTPPIIAKNLTEVFKFLPIFGNRKPKESLKEFNTNKIREFIGMGLNDEQFNQLAASCSPDLLKKGNEPKMSTKFPSHIPLATMKEEIPPDGPGDSLSTVKKLKLRLEKDTNNLFIRTLKYRGIRMLPPPEEQDPDIVPYTQVEPGKDLIFHVRVYRQFQHTVKKRQGDTRHSIFNYDIILLGRQTLADLRDRLVCLNDVSMRTDMSNDPEATTTTTAKEMFPSGFLFINNVFYVDDRAGCHDISAPMHAWVKQRGLGDFPRSKMSVRLDSLHLRLGHPEVYVHQGSCEHMFVFSELRLAGAADPAAVELYPMHSAVSQNQTLYCTTCAEFGARWVVTDCPRVPFDPTFFCDTCLQHFLYINGRKASNFKAYQYRGNEVNALKPQK